MGITGVELLLPISQSLFSSSFFKIWGSVFDDLCRHRNKQGQQQHIRQLVSDDGGNFLLLLLLSSPCPPIQQHRLNIIDDNFQFSKATYSLNTLCSTSDTISYFSREVIRSPRVSQKPVESIFQYVMNISIRDSWIQLLAPKKPTKFPHLSPRKTVSVHTRHSGTFIISRKKIQHYKIYQIN